MITLSSIALLSACGTTSTASPSELSAPIAPDTARVVVERDNSMLFFAAAVTVEANGKKIASLGRGGSVAHDIPAGKAEIEVSTPTAPGQFVVIFDAAAGETYHFVTSPKNDALVLGSAFGIAGDAVRAQISDTSGYFQIEMVKP